METLLFPFIAILSLLPLLFLYFSNPKPEKTPLKEYPFIGHVPHYIKNRDRLLDWQTDLLSATPSQTLILRVAGYHRSIITANPANVEHILKNNFEGYPKGRQIISHLEDFLGHGIFNSDGDLWKSQRKIASFEFNTKSLRNFILVQVQREIFSRLSPLLKKAAFQGDIVDLQDVLERFAFDNICQVAFDEDPACLGKDFDGDEKLFSAFRDAEDISGARFRYLIPKLWKIKKIFNLGSEKRLRESVSIVDEFAFRVIQSRKKVKEHRREDLLSRFMAVADNNSDKFLRDAVIAFILAGRETTSSALSWFFWILSGRPDVEGKILEEIRSVRERNNVERNTPLGFEDLKEMNYLHAALSEAMRLYPPVPYSITASSSDDVLPDGTRVREGDFMSYIAYGMGRMKEIWGEDCREFKPERWLNDGGVFQPESPFKYPIFHGGPRSCLGKEMAYIQMKSVAVTLIENFMVEVVGDGRRPEVLLSMTLRMKGGLPVIIKERIE